MIDHYDWAGGREAMMRFGPSRGPVVVAAPPLFEEANRTRTFVVGLLRALADRGVASVLPDAPGQGESLAPIDDLTVSDLADALAAVTERLGGEGRATIGLGIRSGALLDHRATHVARWHLTPVTGADVVRDLHRVGLASAPAPRSRPATPPAGLLSSLEAARPFDDPCVPRRIVRLSTDPRPADRHVEGAPLWRRAEPGDDPALAQLLADDVAAWIKMCVA